MTELTTGVLFLMYSLYGSGQADGQIKNITAVSSDNKQENVMNMTEEEILKITDPAIMEKYLRQVYADDPILVEIARCESNFKHYDKDGNIVRGIVDKADTGVMQINARYHADTAKKLGFDIHTVTGNIAYAKYLFEKEGTRPWSASKKCWSMSNTVAKI